MRRVERRRQPRRQHPGDGAGDRRPRRRPVTQAHQRGRQDRQRQQRDRRHANPRILADQPGHHRQPLRHHHLAADPRRQNPDRRQQQPAEAAQRDFRPRQMQADGDRRNRQRQRHREFQVEERIAHRDHHVGPDAEFGEEHQKRDRRGRQQRQHQRVSHGPRTVPVVGRQRSNETIGIHSHRSRNFAVRLVSPRCSATRTAPSLIENFAAVSLIEALSTAIDCSTSRCRAGSV